MPIKNHQQNLIVPAYGSWQKQISIIFPNAILSICYLNFHRKSSKYLIIISFFKMISYVIDAFVVLMND